MKLTIRAVISYLDATGQRQLYEARWEDVEWGHALNLIRYEIEAMTESEQKQVTQVQMYKVN